MLVKLTLTSNGSRVLVQTTSISDILPLTNREGCELTMVNSETITVQESLEFIQQLEVEQCAKTNP